MDRTVCYYYCYYYVYRYDTLLLVVQKTDVPLRVDYRVIISYTKQAKRYPQRKTMAMIRTLEGTPLRTAK
jgi:hypothetical protein